MVWPKAGAAWAVSRQVLAKGKELVCSGTHWNAQNAWLRQEPEAVDAAVVAAAPDFASSGVAPRATRISRATTAANPTYATSGQINQAVIDAIAKATNG
jgi:hypothetical protein